MELQNKSAQEDRIINRIRFLSFSDNVNRCRANLGERIQQEYNCINRFQWNLPFLNNFAVPRRRPRAGPNSSRCGTPVQSRTAAPNTQRSGIRLSFGCKSMIKCRNITAERFPLIVAGMGPELGGLCESVLAILARLLWCNVSCVQCFALGVLCRTTGRHSPIKKQ